MQLKCKSDYPNQVQQLNIFISQHYHLLKDETIRWQKSAFNISWNNYKESGKQHLVSFIIRDHFSNCFYAELHSIEAISTIHEFLFNAWRKKDLYEFWGGPEYLIIPKVTQEQFSSLSNFFSNVSKVKLQAPSSGFSTGLASVRQWERFIRYFAGFYKDCKTLLGFKVNIETINREVNSFGSKNSAESSLNKWLNNQPRILNPGDRQRFYNFFKPTV